MDDLDIVQIVNANPGVLSWSQPHTVCLRKGAHGSLGIKINTFKVSYFGCAVRPLNGVNDLTYSRINFETPEHLSPYLEEYS